MSAGDVVATAKMQGEALYLLYLVLLSLKQVMSIKGMYFFDEIWSTVT